MVRRRVALRNCHDIDGVLNTSAHRHLQRRYNILKAIEDECFHREPYKEMDDHDKFDKSYDCRSSDFRETEIFPNDNNNDKSVDSYNKTEKNDKKSIRSSTDGIVSSYVKSFELGRVKWRGPLASNYLKKSSSNYKQTDDYADGYSASASESSPEEPPKLVKVREGNIKKRYSVSVTESSPKEPPKLVKVTEGNIKTRYSVSVTESSPEEPPKLVKVTEGNIKTPSKIKARLANIENRSEEVIAGNFSQMSQSSMQSLTSLAAVIDDLDAQIKALEIEEANGIKTQAFVEPSKRIYPNIEDIKFEPTGWSPQKEGNSREKTFDITETASFTHNVENNDVTHFSNRDIETVDSKTFVKNNADEMTTYQETPKKATRKMPLMESTRKLAHSDSTKIIFPTRTRIESTMSTLSMPNSPEYKDPEGEESKESGNTLDTSAPFDLEQFLQDALGDELYNTSVTFDVSETRDRTNSQFNASDLISKETTPLQRRVMYAMHPPATDPPRGSSNTLNRPMGLYRSLSQRIKKKFRSALKTKEEPPSPPKSSKGSHEADIIGQLLQEVSVQQTLMNQASKALNVCHTMKEFMESSERVESDRLLLIAGLRRTAALEEIKRLSSQESRKDNNILGEKGEITLKDISLNLRECLKGEPQEGETVEWFVVVVSQGLTVWATRAISSPINNLSIDFPEVISIPNLTPNFKILVQVYSLKLRNTTYNHEDKYRIRKHKRSTSCPPFFVSPTKFLKKSERPLSPKLHRSNASKCGCTGFVLSGFVELFLHDLSLSSPWPLMLVPENSILDRTIDLSLACRLHLSASHEGFLNHGDAAGGLARWNRRWCVLKGHTLMLWNYPRDQETKEPLTVIELINCVSNRIEVANRAICARPKSIVIETVRRRNATDRDSIVFKCRSSCTIVRNFLAYDTVPEVLEWLKKLNHVVRALSEWNVIGTKPPQVSDL